MLKEFGDNVLWYVKNKQNVDNLPCVSISMPAGIKGTCVAWSLANEHIVVSTDDGDLVLFDAKVRFRGSILANRETLHSSA